jgi:hypothetical protein
MANNEGETYGGLSETRSALYVYYTLGKTLDQ